MNLIGVIIQAVLAVIKGIWGTSTAKKTTVARPVPEAGVTDGKTDAERLEDCGL